MSADANRWRSVSRKYAAYIILALVTFKLLSWWSPWWSAGEGVSAAEANSGLGMRFVPETATDVWFTIARIRLTYSADCKLDEKAFVAWCQERKWLPKPIEPGHPEHVWQRGDMRFVTDGLVFHSHPYSGVYDATNGRAYVIYSNH